MKRYMPFVLIALLAVFAAQASADNLLVNGSFQSGDFTGWTLGLPPTVLPATDFRLSASGRWTTTSTPGKVRLARFHIPTVTTRVRRCSQMFTTAGGAASFSFMYAAMGDGIHNNADGGDFRLILDGSILADFDVGQITANQIINGTLSANADLSAGTHTFEIDILRPYTSSSGNTPYQYITAADVEGNPVPEPGSLVLIGSGVLGLAGVLRRKIGF